MGISDARKYDYMNLNVYQGSTGVLLVPMAVPYGILKASSLFLFFVGVSMYPIHEWNVLAIGVCGAQGQAFTPVYVRSRPGAFQPNFGDPWASAVPTSPRLARALPQHSFELLSGVVRRYPALPQHNSAQLAFLQCAVSILPSILRFSFTVYVLVNSEASK